MLSFTGSDVAACQCGEHEGGGGGGLRNGAIRSNQALCQFSGFLWFSSACVSCSRKHKACSEKEEEEKKIKRARGLFDRLSVLVEEFCP